MKQFKQILRILYCILIFFGLNASLKLGDAKLPPLAPVFSPFTGFWQQADAVSTKKQLESFRISSLDDKVHVWYDEHMVPHIFAQNDLDAIRAQGYIEARERLWQMDISTRNAAGRLAEILGPSLLERDRLQRRKGLAYAAEKTAEKWLENPEINDIISAYSEGVNAYIDQLKPRDYPLEFKLMQYAPEKWSAYKTALFFKSMAQVLCSYGPDIHLNNTRLYLGDSLFNELFYEYAPEDNPVIPDQAGWSSYQPIDLKQAQKLHVDRIIYNEEISLPPKGIGSNNWAVSGSKTKTGKPILCNDPHLGLTLPSVWFELHIHTPDWNSYGVSFPGAPGVIIGFNQNIAWGFTNASLDVLDWFKVDWEDASKNTYLYEGNLEKIEHRIETINVKGGDTILDTVKYCKWGPIVYENEEYGLAMRWIAHDAPDKPDLLTFYGISKAENWNDFIKASTNYISPAQNIVFASNEGDIGLRVSGEIPERMDQEGRFIRSGNICNSEWDNYIPNDNLPTQYNPDRNYVASANQRSVTEKYPYYITGMFEFYRNRRINQRLEKMENIAVEDMMHMQNEKYSLKAAEYLPTMLRLLERSHTELSGNSYFEKIKTWDYQYLEDSEAAGFFDLWFDQLQRTTYDELYAVKDSFNIMIPDEQIWIKLAKANPEHQIFDLISTNEKENAADVNYIAFKKALTLADEIVDLNGSFDWTLVNNPSIPHLGKIDAFNAKKMHASGSKDAINALHHSFGPSWRMIVSLDKEPKAWGVYPGGQSGNPGSFYYDSSVEDWASGAYRVLLFTTDTLLLREKALIQTTFKP